MANNRITSIDNNAFRGCMILRSLDLSHNHIGNITVLAFQDTKMMRVLHLESNQLTISLLPPAVFFHLQNLEYIHIENNTIENSSFVSGEIYQNLSLLKYLQLDGFPNASFSPHFSHLKSLETLVISGNQMYITDDTFYYFNEESPVCELSISSNLIDVSTHSFSNFHNLKTLNLSYNDHLGFANISKSLHGLDNTKIESLYLVQSAPFNSESTTLDESFTKGLQKTKIKKIVLDSNNILIVDAKFRIYTPHL